MAEDHLNCDLCTREERILYFVAENGGDRLIESQLSLLD